MANLSKDPDLSQVVVGGPASPNFVSDGGFDAGVVGWSGVGAYDAVGTWLNGSFAANVAGWRTYQGGTAATWRAGGFLTIAGAGTIPSIYAASDNFAANFQAGQVITVKPRFKLEGGKSFMTFTCRIMGSNGSVTVGNGDRALAALGAADGEGFYNPSIPITITGAVTPGTPVQVLLGVAGMPSNATSTDVFVVDTVAGTVAAPAATLTLTGGQLRVTGSNATPPNGLHIAAYTQTSNPPTPGTPLFVRAKLTPDGPTPVNVRTQIYAGANQVTSAITNWAPGTDGSMDYRTALTMPDGAGATTWMVRFLITYTTQPTTAQGFLVDNVILGPIDQPYQIGHPLEWPTGVTIDDDGIGGRIIGNPGNPTVEGAPTGAPWTATLATGATITGTIGGTPPTWPTTGTITALQVDPIPAVTAAVGYGQRALITIDTAGQNLGATMTLYRIHNATRINVAGAANIPATSTVIPDVAVELERPIYYEVETSNGTILRSNTITVASQRSSLGPMCLITNPTTGTSAPVVLVQWTQRAYTTQATEIEIPERDDVIHLVGVEMLPTGSPEWLTLDADAADALARLLKPGEIIHCRFACPDYPDVYVAVLSRSTARTGRHSPARLHAWTVTEHRHPSLDIRAVGDTLQILSEAVPTTLADIATRWPTLLSLAGADLATEVNNA